MRYHTKNQLSRWPGRPPSGIIFYTKEIFKNTKGNSVCPLRSGFPDFGPDPDFFVKSSPEMVRMYCQSPDF